MLHLNLTTKKLVEKLNLTGFIWGEKSIEKAKLRSEKMGVTTEL